MISQAVDQFVNANRQTFFKVFGDSCGVIFLSIEECCELYLK